MYAPSTGRFLTMDTWGGDIAQSFAVYGIPRMVLCLFMPSEIVAGSRRVIGEYILKFK